jgi:hypothetical protein
MSFIFNLKTYMHTDAHPEQKVAIFFAENLQGRCFYKAAATRFSLDNFEILANLITIKKDQ